MHSFLKLSSISLYICTTIHVSIHLLVDISGNSLCDIGRTAQRSVTAWRGGRWGGASRGREHRYFCGWFVLMYGRSQHSILKQISCNKKLKKTQSDINSHLLKWLWSKRLEINKCWWGEKGALVHRWWDCKSVLPLWKTVWKFLRKSKIDLPYNLEIQLLVLIHRTHRH